MTRQVIVTPAGERLVVLPEADYEALVEASEDAEDSAAARRTQARLESGGEELLPAAMVERLLTGESPVRVWREHRGLSATALAERAGIAQPYLSQIESGKRDGAVETYRQIALVLDVTVDDLI